MRIVKQRNNLVLIGLQFPAPYYFFTMVLKI